jgi:hypothetical protein
MNCMECGRDNLSERELEVHIKFFHKQMVMQYQQPQKVSSGICPDCKATLWFQEGCVSCHSCGYSKCG